MIYIKLLVILGTLRKQDMPCLCLHTKHKHGLGDMPILFTDRLSVCSHAAELLRKLSKSNSTVTAPNHADLFVGFPAEIKNVKIKRPVFPTQPTSNNEVTSEETRAAL